MPDDTPAEARASGNPRGANGQYVRSMKTAERDAAAARLRSRGWSYPRIAAELGVSVGTAHDAVQRALKAIVAEPAAEARTLELERLDALYATAYDVITRMHPTVQLGKVIRGPDGEPVNDDTVVLAAVDRLLRVSESRRKLLGLDAPQRLRAELTADRVAEVMALADQLAGGDDPAAGGAP